MLGTIGGAFSLWIVGAACGIGAWIGVSIRTDDFAGGGGTGAAAGAGIFFGGLIGSATGAIVVPLLTVPVPQLSQHSSFLWRWNRPFKRPSRWPPPQPESQAGAHDELVQLEVVQVGVLQQSDALRWPKLKPLKCPCPWPQPVSQVGAQLVVTHFGAGAQTGAGAWQGSQHSLR